MGKPELARRPDLGAVAKAVERILADARRMTWILVTIIAIPGALAAQETTGLTIERGDVLSVTVIDEPTLGREAKVDALGRIMLPRLGSIDVAGQGLDRIRQTIETELSERDIILEPTVVVEVASYRPIYVGGAVAQQGAVPYEPGLTVRHALLLAGGVDLDESEDISAADLLAMNAEWRATAFALLEVNSRIARLEAELEHRAELRPLDVPAEDVAGSEAAEIRTLDSALLSERLEIRSAQEEHLHDLMGVIDVELDVLGEQAAHQQRESELQEEDVQNAQALLEKGLTSQPRVRELQREQLQLTRSRLDVQAYTARARQNKETIGYELQNSDRVWRIETRARLRDAVLERTEIESEAELLTARLLAAGMSPDGGTHAGAARAGGADLAGPSTARSRRCWPG